MARLTDITLSVGRTISLGNYENLRIEAGGTMTIEEGDDIDAARASLMKFIRESLNEQYKAHHPDLIPR